jgi:hypothetical protein
MSETNSIESHPKVAIRINVVQSGFLGLFSNNVGPFSRNLVLSGSLFSVNLVRK